MMRKPTRAAALCALLFTFFALLSTAAPDAAAAGRHLRLLRSVPDTGSVVQTAPAAIELWFSEAPQARLTTVRLRSGQNTVQLAQPEVNANDGKHITAKVTQPLSPGSHEVSWRTMARDGHVVTGTFTFTYTP